MFTYLMETGTSSVAIVNYDQGGPHQRVWAAFGDNSANYTPLVLCSDEDQPGTWNSFGVSATSEICTGPVSLQAVNGLPALFYARKGDPGTGGLSYVRANDPAGTAWGSVKNLDNTGRYAAAWLSSSLSAGRPAVATMDLYTSKFNFVRATDVNGATWPVINAGPGGFTDGIYGLGLTILAGGDPALAISTFSSSPTYESGVYFNSAYNADGSSWPPSSVKLHGPETNTSGGCHSVGCAVIDGNPAVAYGTPDGQLLYQRSNDDQGYSWSTPRRIDKGNTYPGFDYITLLVVDGRPLAIYQRNQTDVGGVQALDANGTAWDEPLTIDSPGTLGMGCAAATDGALVAISYLDPIAQRQYVTWR
jgi:hypothetical protein